ncbi:hypothetical protein AX17_006462 [Amanita inopinata Kibby_2008]|nr:hypothetical protein AX17_006462 [Amanita inopinata Kibby_2008]
MLELDISKINHEIYTDEKTQAIQQSYLNATKSLEEARATVDELQKKQEMLLCDIKYFKAALAPHKRLPNDILREIFILCAQAYGPVTFPLGSNRNCWIPQLILPHVCSPWRRVALSAGAFWSYINVFQLRSQKTRDICEIWFQRAGRSHVMLQNNAAGDTSPNLDTLFRKMFPSIRITRFYLRISVAQLVELSDLPDDALPYLEELKLSMAFHSPYSGPLLLPSFVRHTCLFQCAWYNGNNTLVYKLALPWDKIRYLDLYHARLSTLQCFGLLSQMTSLEQCRLDITWDKDENVTGERSEITLPRLKILILSACEEVLVAMTHVILAPELKKLSLRTILRRGAETIAMLKTRWNFCRLEEVELSESGGDIPIDILLKSGISLCRVVLPREEDALEPDIVAGLATGCLGRYLEAIEVPRQCRADAILSMVEQRQKNSEDEDVNGGRRIAPLKYVNFWSQDNYTTHSERIATLKKSGVEVVMNGHPFAARETDDGDDWDKLARPTHIYPHNPYK